MPTSWLAPATVPPLLEDTVQVWRCTPDAADLARAHRLLTPDERERAARIRAGAPQDEFIAARGALRLLLGNALGEPAQHLEFLLGKHGKPCLASAGLDFNVSHSGGCVLLALSRAGAVGVDIEPLDRKVEAMELAQAHFHPREVAAIAAQPDESLRLALFFRCWTRKEAIVKADGRGLQLPLDAFCVLGDEGPARIQLPGSAPLWVRDLAVGPGFAAALAFPNRNIPIHLYELNGLL